MLNRSMTHQSTDAERLLREADRIIERAELQRRDLSDFEAGQVETLLSLARRHSIYRTREARCK